MRAKQDRPTYAMSRRRRNGIIALSLLCVALLVWLDHSAAARRWRSGWSAELDSQDRSQANQEKYHARTFKVVDVVDGDTIDIDAPDGAERRTRIRLLGIDAPETRSEHAEAMYFGSEAKQSAKELLHGKSIDIYVDAPNPTRDKYGRLLAYVRLPGGKFANEVLLAEGLVYADIRFAHSLFNKYRQLESSARSTAKGLWPGVTPDQLPAWRRQRAEDRERTTEDR